MITNKIRKNWEAKKAVVNAWISAPFPLHAEMAAHAGFDSVCMDMQHGLIDLEHIPGMLSATSHGEVSVICRVPWLEPVAIMKALDYGSDALICPMINTAGQAEQFVRLSSYPPIGIRSFGPTRACVIHGAEYHKKANDTLVRFAMIETKEAVANAEAIMTTKGIDAVYIGPSDLSFSYGLEPKLDHESQKMLDIISHILKVSKRQGKHAGIHCASPAYAKKMLALGFDFVTPCTDISLVRKGFNTALKEMRNHRQ